MPLLTPEMPTFAVGLTPEEKKLYSQLFKALDPDATGTVTGEKARATFEKSGLPPNILGEIWQLSDQNNHGFLSQFGFCHAMRLIGYTQAGTYPTAGLADTPGPLPQFADLPSLSAQPTSSLLLQTQPSLAAPPAPAHDPVGPVSPQDYTRFAQMYVKTTGSATAPLDGNTARDIFLKAKLPTDTLGRIWGLVDVANRGALDLAAFVMAMHLIHGVLSGTLQQLPPFLSDHVWLLVRSHDAAVTAPRAASYSSVLSQQTVRHAPVAPRVPLVAERAALPAADEWVATATQIQQMDSIFDSLDRDRAGQLTPDQVAGFLMTLRLDQADLAAIWDLADIQNTGVFGRLEFGLALFLVNRRRAGLALPDVVPASLVASLRPQAQARLLSQSTQLPKAAQAQLLPPPQTSKSSLDELADIFGATPPPPATVPAATASDLSYSSDLPKVRKQLTSSFKPTSTFGQTLLANDTPSLIGDDVTHSPTKTAASLAPVAPVAPEPPKTRAVDYEALRSVPPPPPKSRETSSTSTGPAQPEVSSGASDFATFSPPPAFSAPLAFTPARQFSPAPEFAPPLLAVTNNDLLADPSSDVSGKLSEATSDIANISNQVKSLTGQTSSLHEKKIRAEQELARILATKQDIEAKLKQLRTSYANEVAQVEQVEADLASAQEESEALRSEASITEAKLNLLSGELNEKQVAVEELQKTNSSLKEKLGNMNAEITELEKEIEAKTAANTQWTNDYNVKKSQLQVVLVKVDDHKRTIADLDAANLKLQQDVDQAHQDKLTAEAHTKELQAHHERLVAQQKELHAKRQEVEQQKKAAQDQKKAAEKQKMVAEEQVAAHTTLLSQASSGLGSAASVLTGAVVGGVAVAGGAAALVGSSILSAHGDSPFEASPVEVLPVKESPVEGSSVEDSPAEESVTESPVVEDIFPTVTSKEPEPLAVEQKQNQIPGSFERTPASLELDEIPEASADITAVADINVDQFVEEPSADLTGLGEAKTDKASEATEFKAEEIQDLKSRFPEVDYDQTDQTVSSSGVADSYRQIEGETPITSPDNSEYRYLAGTAGVVGSLVGMPGVLVGVQRTDSLTSSVQNNASMSVRDDNIDTVSDRETLDEAQSLRGEATREKASAHDDYSEGEGDGELHSSGVGLFELVNADDAKFSDGHLNLADSAHLQDHEPEATETRSKSTDEEFPPIKELDYDESSSSDEESPERFDDAVDSLNTGVVSPAVDQPGNDFDDDFDDLAPAAEEKPKTAQDDFFGDEFDELTAAQDDKELFDVDAPEADLDEIFTGSADVNDFGGAPSEIPDFSAASNTQDGNDEWEQLFAGFGSAGTAAVAAPVEPARDASKNLAIDELIGMGFERDVVVAALEKENWDIEAATNFLLDSA